MSPSDAGVTSVLNASGASPTYLREGSTDSKVGWLAVLEGDHHAFDDLLEFGGLRRLHGSKGPDQVYILNLVGTVFLKDRCLFVVPKASGDFGRSSSALLGDFMAAIHAIAAYRRDLESKAATYLAVAEPFLVASDGNFVDIFEALIAWTDQYGFHSSDEMLPSRVDGKINWPATIRACNPLHGDSFTLYDRPIRNRRRRLDGQLIEYQALALISLFQALGPVGEAISAPFSHFKQEAESVIADLVSSPSPKMILRDLDEYLAVANRDHDLVLAHLLRSFYRQIVHGRRGVRRAYGLVGFHQIWERACAALWMAKFEKLKFADVAHSAIGLDGSTIGNWLIPDFTAKNHHGVVLLDAKWHDPKRPFASTDLVKQFMYALTTNSSLPIALNAFLTPGAGSAVTIEGELCIENSDALWSRNPSIKVIGLPWRRVLEAYATSTPSALVAEIESVLSSDT